jgi:predicted nucleotidyltransferase
MKERRKILNKIAERFELSLIYAFGSKANEVLEWLEYEKFELSISSSSDVDIGVKPYPGKKLSVRKKVYLAMALEDFFAVRKVDLVVIPEVDPFLAANIVRGERIYCRTEYEADEYDLYVLRRAGDLAPLEKERMALVLGDDS